MIRVGCCSDDQKIVWIDLVPFKPALRAVNLDSQSILVSRRDPTRPKRSTRTVSIAQEDLGVVVKPATLDERGQFRAKLCHLNTNDKIRKIVRVSPNVADAAARTCPCRIRPPFGLLLATRLKPLGKSILRIFGLDDLTSPSSPACTISRA
jgi:hypothetical protein